MSDNTHIQWADATWNPATGCTKVSAGCDNCYIERTPPFRMAHRRFDQPGPGGATGVQLHPDRLAAPLRWRKPRRVFVNSLADLFHEQVPDEFIARVFAVMAATPQHTYQILTKRHARMRSLLCDEGFEHQVSEAATDLIDQGRAVGPTGIGKGSVVVTNPRNLWRPVWPLPNVWLGVSVENQQWADIRIPALLDTPAAVRFLSCEPLLGPVDLTPYLRHQCDCGNRPGGFARHYRQSEYGPRLDWLIAGGESGPGARPMHPDWARSLRDQCQTAGVPFFFKQWGEWQHGSTLGHRPVLDHVVLTDGRHYPASEYWESGQATRDERDHKLAGGEYMARVGKHAAGRELDGRVWNEYPATAAAAR